MHTLIKNSNKITEEQKSLLKSVEMECGDFDNIEDVKMIVALAEGKISAYTAKRNFIERYNLEV